jgi:CRP-like cAMP-binding protein
MDKEYIARIKPKWNKYRHLWKKLEVPGKTILLREGEVSKKIFVIDKGCARQWFNNDGDDISFQFFFEGDILSSPESFRNGIPSPFNIETIEPTELRWIGMDDMEILKKDAEIYEYIIARSAERQAEFMRHFFTFLKYSPRQRYETLLQKKPEIVQRVPLQYVASYLGITQVSLSRIRNKKK